MIQQPALFISHGAPDLAIRDEAASRFLRDLGRHLERPDAIVVASAHDEARGVVVRAPARFRTWHDFGNFDRRLFEMRYEPEGAADVADEAFRLLSEAGLSPARSEAPQLDHGAWVPLSLIFPDADIPLVTVSIDPRRRTEWHDAVGRALAPLRERNVLVVGSGSISHNLREVFAGRSQDRQWVDAFTSWLADRAEAGDRDALLRVMNDAPEALRNHPTDEHLLPFFVALGAGEGKPGRRLHHSYTYNILAMDAYAFGTVPEPVPE
ncbi:MAG: DODA-type extradiol aromatic ring-opening family dioxygenase [Allosphingosinicella sp.]|uniref:DODA-type extradiol aromatic ring-opening family dioxygenase n=1 Tax=Allosphingosinicella sp. TaxID=2823234 RepID=UPI0039509714